MVFLVCFLFQIVHSYLFLSLSPPKRIAYKNSLFFKSNDFDLSTLISFGFTCFLQNPSIRSLWQLFLFNRNKVSIFLFISTCSVSLISQEKGGFFLAIDSLFIHVPKGNKKVCSFTLWVLIHIYILFSLSFPCCIFFQF